MPHVVVDPAHGWNEPSRIAGAMVRAQPEPLCAAPSPPSSRAPRRTSRGRAHGWKPIGALARRSPRELEGVAEPSEPGLQAALGRLYADGELVYTASSMPIRDQEAFLPGGEAEVLFLANRGANGIDGLVSSGIGAAAASGRPTIIVTGDLGLLHDLGGLAAVAEATAPVRIVVVANDGGGIFDFLPQASQLGEAEFEALLTTPRGLDPAKAASLFGLPHRRIESLAELGEALAAGTGLIEVPVDRSANVALHRRLAAAAQAACRRGVRPAPAIGAGPPRRPRGPAYELGSSWPRMAPFGKAPLWMLQ